MLMTSRSDSSNYFYPRPPRGGRRSAPDAWTRAEAFLSTPSARRATHCPGRCKPLGCYFYPRPPRGGRRDFDKIDLSAMDFYPRPPRGGRPEAKAVELMKSKFLSTPSARRATPQEVAKDG